MTTETRAVNLFWTGGWDSTFRLLSLVLGQGRRVQPHYLIDVRRRSLGLEIKTMGRLKRDLLRKHPAARGLILPTRYAHVADVEPVPEISDAFRAVTASWPVAVQTEWLAFFCRRGGIEDMEHGAHAGGRVNACLRALLTVREDGSPPVYGVGDDHAGTPEHGLFRDFRFPLLDIGKSGMEEIARREGWMDLMGRTWFCLRPRPRGVPCGYCHPCRLAVRQGMGWRLPWRSRLGGILTRALRIRSIRRRGRRLLRSLRGGAARR